MRKAVKKEHRENNLARAKRIGAVMMDYTGEKHDDESNVVDVLTDILHFCAVHDKDFDDCLRIARDHFEAEVEGIDDP